MIFFVKKSIINLIMFLDIPASVFFGIWRVLSLILSLCFSCNLVAVLFIPEYDATVDNACDVLKSNLVKTLHKVLKGLSNVMEGGIKVVSIERSL